MAIDVVLAEDNLLVREGIASLLATVPDVNVVGTCATLDELLEAVERTAPDLVITDIRMPPGHSDEGIVASRLLRSSHPDLGVLVLSQFVEPAYAVALLDGGAAARGYLLKERIDDLDLLVQAVRTVSDGGSFIDDVVVDALVRARTRMVDDGLEVLSSREREVLSEMATGATNAIIADRLHIGLNAVEKHSNSIFSKLGLSDDPSVNRRVKAVLTFLSGRTDEGL